MRTMQRMHSMSAKSNKIEEKSKKRGRPTRKTPEIVDKICELISLGYTNRQACEQAGIEQCMLYTWIAKDEAFAEQYARACDFRCQRWADEITEITDDATNDWIEREKKNGESGIVFNREHFERSRLRVDTRKWLLSKLVPKKYGDKVDHQHSGEINITVTVSEKKE